MLIKIKLVISTLVLLVAAGIAFYDYRIGLYPPAAVALGVGMFVVFAIWVFPDVKRKGNVKRNS